jgi:hypothetical protein
MVRRVGPQELPRRWFRRDGDGQGDGEHRPKPDTPPPCPPVYGAVTRERDSPPRISIPT